MGEQKKINITGEPSLDPQVCKFIVDYPLFEGKSCNCRTIDMAKGSPLLEALFAIDGISQVMVSDSTLTIAKRISDPWPLLGKQIGKAVRDTINLGVTLIADTAETMKPSEQDIRNKIEELFEKEINPQIASHGGFVELADVEDTKVYVRLGGGCQGCSSANATLKQGIAKAIHQILPEVTEVLDATDHASGLNPYYQ